MEENYVNAVIGNTSEFCKIFNSYEDELKDFGVKYDAISKEVYDYFDDVVAKGNPSEESYNALDDSRKYHDANGQVIPYGGLTVTQKRGLTKEALFIADKGIELNDKMAEASYNMKQSAQKFVKDLQDKMAEVGRSNNRLNQLNLQYVADMARNQIVIDDCLHEATKATTVEEKKSIADRRIEALKNNRKTELTLRINTALINATNLVQTVFSQVIANMESTITNEFKDVDSNEAQIIEDKMDIMSDLTKLMASFTNIKKEYEAEKELITSIDEKCKAMKKSTEDKDIKKFASDVMKSTKEFSKLIENIQKYNEVNVNNLTSPTESTPITEPTPAVEETPVTESTPVVEETPVPEAKPVVETPSTSESKPIAESTPTASKVSSIDSTSSTETETDTIENYKDAAVYYKVNRVRVRKSATANTVIAVSALTLAAAGLGFAGPTVAGLATAGIALGTGCNAFKLVSTACSRGAITHKLKKIAKNISKDIPGFKLGKPDYEKGTINFVMEDGDEKGVVANSTNLPPDVYSRITTMLNEAFHNEDRGLGDRKTVTTRQVDLHELPKVTIDNLQAAYATIGGIETLGTTSDIINSAWTTSSELVAKAKDKIVSTAQNVVNKFSPVSADELSSENIEEKVSETEVGPVVREETPVSSATSENETEEIIDDLDGEEKVSTESTDLNNEIKESDMDAADLVSHLGEAGKTLNDEEIAELLDVLETDEKELDELPSEELGRTR